MANICLKLIGLIAISTPLAGCFVSDEPFFDASETVRSVPTGIWKIEDPREPSERRSREVVVDYKDGHYVYSPLDQDLSIAFDLVPLNDRSWIVQMRGHRATYGVLETKFGHYEYFAPDCSAFQADVSFLVQQPEVVSGSYSTDCKFSDKTRLKSALLSYSNDKGMITKLTFARKIDPSPSKIGGSSSAASNPQGVGVVEREVVRESSRAPTPADKRNSESKLFTLTLCNKSDAPADAILFHKHLYDDKKWVLSGWKNVGARGCAELRIPRGYFYIAATNSKGLVWSGTDRHICTSFRAVERVVFENERCLPGEINRGFSEIFNAGDNYTYNLTQ